MTSARMKASVSDTTCLKIQVSALIVIVMPQTDIERPSSSTPSTCCFFLGSTATDTERAIPQTRSYPPPALLSPTLKYTIPLLRLCLSQGPLYPSRLHFTSNCMSSRACHLMSKDASLITVISGTSKMSSASCQASLWRSGSVQDLQQKAFHSCRESGYEKRSMTTNRRYLRLIWIEELLLRRHMLLR